MFEWKDYIEQESSKNYFKALKSLLDEKYQNIHVLPDRKDILNAFKFCPFNKIKVVIVGQDPYPVRGLPNGMSFSINDGCGLPQSLKNVFQEVESSTDVKCLKSGNLERWARQGVLLMDSVLTVNEGSPGSHQNLGWELFTGGAIKTICDKMDGVIFMLWGEYAMSRAKLITGKQLILKAAHPSPMSATLGFFGCDHFHRANMFLNMEGKDSIIWQ